MKGVVVTTDMKIHVQDFGEPLYKTVGAAVGGYIEHVLPLGLKKPYCMIVNKEGLLENLPINSIGCLLYGTAVHQCPIVGNIMIMKDGFRNGEPDIVGLDENEAEEMLKTLKQLVRC